MKNQLTWKQVAHWDNQKLWTDLVCFMDAAWFAGYQYGLFYDGVVYTMDKDGTVKSTDIQEADIL